MEACVISTRGKPRSRTASRIDAIMDALGLSVGVMASALGMSTRALLELRKADALPQMHGPRVALEQLARRAKVNL